MSKIQPKPPGPPDAPPPLKKPAAGAPPAPFTPARPRATAVAVAPARPARAGAAASASERARDSAAGEARADAGALTRFDPLFSPIDQDEEGSGRRGGASSASTDAAGALDQELDSAELARLLPVGGNDGIFDVALPGGERMGVVVSGQSGSLSYLLSPSTEKLGARLRRQRMELESRVERLTHRNVNITVL